MTNLNPLYILAESKEFRKAKYGANFKQHEKLIKDAVSKRERIDSATKPSKKWASGTRLELSQLGKSVALPERKASGKGKVSDTVIRKSKKLIDKSGVKRWKDKLEMGKIKDLTKKGLANIVKKIRH